MILDIQTQKIIQVILQWQLVVLRWGKIAFTVQRILLFPWGNSSYCLNHVLQSTVWSVCWGGKPLFAACYKNGKVSITSKIKWPVEKGSFSTAFLQWVLKNQWTYAYTILRICWLKLFSCTNIQYNTVCMWPDPMYKYIKVLSCCKNICSTWSLTFAHHPYLK